MRRLMILEVSQKQAYIFASHRLRENAARSEDIRYVTESRFFQTAAGPLYREEDLVYAGGGHTVLQFDSRERADAFARAALQKARQQGSAYLAKAGEDAKNSGAGSVGQAGQDDGKEDGKKGGKAEDSFLNAIRAIGKRNGKQ